MDNSTMGFCDLKLETFYGSNFNAWRLKIVFGMQLLKIYYVVTNAKPMFGEDDAAEDAQWERDNDFCKSYFFNSLSNHLVDVYTQKDSAKDIWDGLVQQYRDEEKHSKTHHIDKFLDMKFEDDKKVLPQVKELEKLVQKLKEEKVELDNVFVAGEIANKLPPSWMSLSTEMHPKKKQVPLSDLKRFIRIEDEVRICFKNELLAN
ncbi:uncharacterized protein LOC143889526 [Tasmannia lanceolata]|uniref:uncharacterized protein LOC143889526 n=1 Tax=Tasmannia lanceolata TaxID=3420 RepID=UPI004062D57D